ncbi:unnamed protein product, partial [Prorocentrum cordatum]
MQRSPKVNAAPHRSPRQAQGFKSQTVDRESIRLMMDDVLQKHTKQILQAIDKHASTFLDSTGDLEMFDNSLDASVAFVDPADGPRPCSRLAPPLLQD